MQKMRLFIDFSGEIVVLKNLQLDWLKACRPTSQEHDFSQYRICA